MQAGSIHDDSFLKDSVLLDLSFKHTPYYNVNGSKRKGRTEKACKWEPHSDTQSVKLASASKCFQCLMLSYSSASTSISSLGFHRSNLENCSDHFHLLRVPYRYNSQNNPLIHSWLDLGQFTLQWLSISHRAQILPGVFSTPTRSTSFSLLTSSTTAVI